MWKEEPRVKTATWEGQVTFTSPYRYGAFWVNSGISTYSQWHGITGFGMVTRDLDQMKNLD